MTPRLFLLAFLVYLPSSFYADTQPNILVILADDLGYGTGSLARSIRSQDHKDIVERMVRQWEAWANRVESIGKGIGKLDQDQDQHRES